MWLPGAIEGIGKKIFGNRRGVIRGYYLRFTGAAKTFDGGYNINSLQNQLHLATTFGYLDNKEDLYHIWNIRVRNLFNPNIQYSCTKAIFALNEEALELRLDPELSEDILQDPQLRMGYYKSYSDEKGKEIK